MVGLTWGSLRTCERVQGTSSCGTAGYPMLLVVLVTAVVLGALLLRLLRVPDPVSTSFLGVGLATVLALLFLVDRLEQRAMVLVIPVLVGASYAAAHWVTTTFIEPGHRDR
jgi:ABC-type transport system involved in cytochrome c biogenesis permease subunit